MRAWGYTTTCRRQEIIRGDHADHHINQRMVRDAVRVHARDAWYLRQLRGDIPAGRGTVLAGQEERHAFARGVGIDWAHEVPDGQE